MSASNLVKAGKNQRLIDLGIRGITAENIQAGIKAGFFNGATVGVVTSHGRDIVAEGLLQACGKPLQGDEIYDLASCTKLFTTVLFHNLMSRNLLDGLTMESEVHETLNLSGPHVGQLKVKHLLWFLVEYMAAEPTSALATKGADIITLIKSKGLSTSPGRKWKYCNHSYILLGLLIEALTRRPLHQMLKREILHPLEMEETSYFPWEWDNTALRRYVPTENGLRGFAHDESASYLMRTKRIAVGSAGLFAPVSDLLHLLAMFIDEGYSRHGKPILKRQIVKSLGVNCTSGLNETFGNGVGLYSSFCEGLEHAPVSEGTFFKGAYTGGQIVCSPADKIGFAIFTDYLALGRRPQKGAFHQWLAKTGGDIIQSLRTQ